jgi:hypothetical protein
MELFIGGAILLIYIGFVVAGILWVLSWAKRRGFGWGGRASSVLMVVLAGYAIPFGDHTIGLLKFKNLCSKYAGAMINETISNVEGFMWETGRISRPHTHGYSFYEIRTPTNEIYRYVRRDDGTVGEIKGDRPKAKYVVRRSARTTISTHVTKSQLLIQELNTARTIAGYTTLHYHGGWLIRELDGIGISGPSCPSEREPFETISFVQSILLPSRSTGSR